MIPDAPPNDPAALTTFIEARFHQSHRAQLPSLAALYDGLRTFLNDLEAHIRLEDDVLFPRFKPSA